MDYHFLILFIFEVLLFSKSSQENHLHDDAGIELISLLDEHAIRLRCLGLSCILFHYTSSIS